LGFNLSPQDAKGGTAAAPEGFFFVFQQHPTGPRFGLEASAAGTVSQWGGAARPPPPRRGRRPSPHPASPRVGSPAPPPAPPPPASPGPDRAVPAKPAA